MQAERVFETMLWCLPTPFRHEYGPEMVHAFADELREARRQQSPRAVAAVWARSISGLFVTAPQEHYYVMKNEMHYALRTMAAQPGFSIVAVLSLALGIGANVAIFSLVHAVLYQSLPVRNPSELVMLTDPSSRGSSTGMEDGDRSLLTHQEYLQLQERTGVFTQLMAAQSRPEAIQVRVNGTEPEEVRGRLVSANYFSTLGVSALIGRTPAAEDSPRAPLAVISHDFWQRRFGGSAQAIGASIAMRLGTFTVVGVMPPGFFGETVGDSPEVWLPLELQPVVLPGRDWLHDNPKDLQKTMWLHAFGRLKPGVPLDQAQAEANVVFQQGLADYYSSAPSDQAKRGFLNQRLKLRAGAIGASGIRDTFGEPLTILLAAAGLVLAIACANLGNLMLARVAGRTREIAVRLALGAGRADLFRQMLTESVLLALAGGAVGVGVAWLLRKGLLALAPASIQLPSAMEPSVALFAFGVTAGAGLLLGLLPALRAITVDAGTGLKEQGRGITASAGWLRAGKLVVAGQVALSLPLLVSAGLLIRTLQNLQDVDLGYSKDNLLMLRADVQRAGYEEPRRQALFDRLHERVRAVPGVAEASYSAYGVLMGSDTGDEVAVEGYVAKGDDDRGSRYDHIGPGFFKALGVPLLLGREFDARDRASSPRVCVINEAFAKTFFAGRNPIGMHVTQLYGHQKNTYEVIGVSANHRKRSLRGEIEHRYFVPAAQPIDVPWAITLVVRTAGDPAAMVNTLRKAMLAEDANLPITGAAPVNKLVEDSTLLDRMLARLSMAFGVIALLLAAIGLYGVLSHGVARRTGEIGIRKALGARESALTAMILRETVWLMIGGLAAGALLAYASTAWIASRLYGLAPHDPVAAGGAVVLLGAVALVAAWLPARRASRVDPLIAIRHE